MSVGNKKSEMFTYTSVEHRIRIIEEATDSILSAVRDDDYNLLDHQKQSISTAISSLKKSVKICDKRKTHEERRHV